MLSLTVGTSRSTYEYDGRSGDIDLMLWPVNFTLAYVGYEVLAPFVAYGVEAGLRYSDASTVESRLRAVVADFRNTLPRLAERETVPFNRMEEWGADGRITAGARVQAAPRFGVTEAYVIVRPVLAPKPSKGRDQDRRA